jgi:hypothetical protein
MTWSQTNRRWQALREIEALANAGCTELPWNHDYAAVFGTREELVAALRYRLDLTWSTQVDPSLPEPVLDEQRARLEARHAGVLRILRSWDAADGTYAGLPCDPITDLPGPVTAA